MGPDKSSWNTYYLNTYSSNLWIIKNLSICILQWFRLSECRNLRHEHIKILFICLFTKLLILFRRCLLRFNYVNYMLRTPPGKGGSRLGKSDLIFIYSYGPYNSCGERCKRNKIVTNMFNYEPMAMWVESSRPWHRTAVPLEHEVCVTCCHIPRLTRVSRTLVREGTEAGPSESVIHFLPEMSAGLDLQVAKNNGQMGFWPMLSFLPFQNGRSLAI